MNKYIFILLFLFKFSLFTDTFVYYRPMSKKSIDFGDDVCYYEDISGDSKLMYVKGCPSGKSCKFVGESANNEYRIRTCQVDYSFSKRKTGENCDQLLFECDSTLECTSGKCAISGSGSGSTTDVCPLTKQVGTGLAECVRDATEIARIGNLCESTDTSDVTTVYTHASTSKSCKKLEITLKESGGVYYIKSKELVDLYSIEDGQYVLENSNIYCKSGFSLYFYGNGGQTISASSNQMYKRCVTVLALNAVGSDFYIKYKIKDESEHIYDTSKLEGDYKTNQNTECGAYLLMTKLEMFKYMVEEYKNGNNNKYKKWSYLYAYPEHYLLYKDQIDVLDYLIQSEISDYIPELLSNEAAKTQPTQETQPTPETESTDTSEPENEFSKLINIHYFTILLFLFIF